MALKLEFTQHQGFVCAKEHSYLKVTNVSGNKESVAAEITFYHVVGAERFACKSHSVTFMPSLLAEDGDIIHQAYNAIKSSVGFELAEDC